MHCGTVWQWTHSSDDYLVCVCKGLTMEQVDALWNCLAVDPLSSDDCLNWFLTTAKSKDYHALSINTLRHIFVDKALHFSLLTVLLYHHFNFLLSKV